MDNGLKIYALARTYGMTDPVAKFIAAQAGHETDGFTSPLFKSDNNAFGMTYYTGQPFSGKSTRSFTDSSGKKVFYSNYITLEASVAGFMYWWTIHRAGISFPVFINTLAGYVSFLKSKDYFEAPEAEYLKGCQFFLTKYFNE